MYHQMKRRIGILTSGGDCPGLNAAIRGVARASYSMFDAEIIGIQDGYSGLIDGDYRPMRREEFSGILTLGGTILGTKRTPYRNMRVIGDDNVDKVKAMKENYKRMKLDCLVCLGGNGTHKTANLLSEEGLNVIGLPKTIDNDIWLTDVTFGFHTAVDIATDVIDRIHTTAASHGRCMVIEIMGNKAAVEARARSGKDFSILAVAEGAMTRAEADMKKKERAQARAEAGFSGIAARIAKELEAMVGVEARAVVPGHIQRGGSPSAYDRVLATRFGVHAAELIRDENYGQAVGMDGFHHTNTYLDRHTLDCPDGKSVSLRSIKGAPETFDVEGFARALHETRVSSGPVQWPAYSRVAHDVVADGPIVSAPIVIVEGNYLLLDESPWRDLAELCDLSIFVEADEAMLRERLVARKMRGGLSRTEAERFFEQSDGKNVRRVLARRCPADIAITLDSSGRMRRLEATPALAFFDIDGTLTWAKEGEADIDAAPTDAVRLALENFVARGNLAVLCTGRPLCNVPPALKTLPFAGMVTLAGGHVELDGEVVRDVGMPSDVVELLVSCCERARVPAYFESSSRGVVLAWPGVFSLFDTFGEFSERVGIEELRGVLAGIDVGKVVFDSEHIELLLTMAPAITERCSVCNIGDGLYEVTVPGITKFDGMRAVWSALRERDVRIGTVYGFGDSENDGSMLSAVDVAVAMGNALPAVRVSADYVTDPVWDNGVAAALEAFGLV